MKMVSEEDVKKVKEELAKLIGFIADHDSDIQEDSDYDLFTFAMNVSDAIDWFLGETPTDDFVSDAFLNMERLREVAHMIERKTGENFEGYMEKIRRQVETIKKDK
jgi:hypothetical protein